jgi:hypothetical protein
VRERERERVGERECECVCVCVCERERERELERERDRKGLLSCASRNTMNERMTLTDMTCIPAEGTAYTPDLEPCDREVALAAAARYSTRYLGTVALPSTPT